MASNYSDSVPVLERRLDYSGCLYGQQSRQMTKCIASGESCEEKMNEGGCLFGKETRWIVKRIDDAVTKMLWLFAATVVGVAANIGVSVILRK